MGQGGGHLSDKKTLTVVLLKGPYVSEAADMALNTVLKAKSMGYDVNLYLYLDGTWISHIIDEKDYNNPGEWLRWAVKNGINVYACERCSKARDLKEGEIIDGVNIGAGYVLMDWMKNSDKVMVFGG